MDLRKVQETIRRRWLLYLMMGCQMAAWSWYQSQAGNVSDNGYLTFCSMMAIGQIGTAIECILGKTWGTLLVQVFFFIFTVVGFIGQLQEMGIV